jgi:hypothetical protein
MKSARKTDNRNYRPSCFEAMPNLRIVHFRYLRYRELDDNHHFLHKRPTEVNWEIQRFANAFFRYLDSKSICLNLNAVVVGCHWDVNVEDPRDTDYYHVPRHCFVKGHQTDPLGRSTAVAVPVPACLLRQAQPVSGILDLDPGCEWVGVQAARIREA